MKASKKIRQRPKGSIGWDTAVKDAEAEIRRLQRRISVLQGGIVVFKDRKSHGEPFPGQMHD